MTPGQEDRLALQKIRVCRECMAAIADGRARGLEPELVLPPPAIAFPESKELVLQVTKLVSGARLSEGKLALLQDNTPAFVAWANQYYGALGQALQANLGALRSVEDMVAVLDHFLTPQARA